MTIIIWCPRVRYMQGWPYARRGCRNKNQQCVHNSAAAIRCKCDSIFGCPVVFEDRCSDRCVVQSCWRIPQVSVVIPQIPCRQLFWNIRLCYNIWIADTWRNLQHSYCHWTIQSRICTLQIWNALQSIGCCNSRRNSNYIRVSINSIDRMRWSSIVINQSPWRYSCKCYG